MGDGRGFDQAVRALEKLLAERADDAPPAAGHEADAAEAAPGAAAEN